MNATREERAAAGKAARTRCPRSSHEAWDVKRDSQVAVARVEAQDADRIPWLVPERRRRMSTSPFAFFRGAAAVMAADLAPTPRTGFEVQACGDAHLMNFGAYASPERQLVFDVNDFDETLTGPWEWDVKRLAASAMIAAQENEYDEATCRTITFRCVEEYRLAMQRLATMGALDVWYAYLTEEQLRSLQEIADDSRTRRRLEHLSAKAHSRDSLQAFEHLTEEVDGRRRIRSDPPLLLPLRELTAEQGADEFAGMVRGDFEQYAESLSNDRRRLLERFEPLDVAIKVVGVGSVGTQCLIALFEGRDAGEPLLLQVKEATRSVLEAHLAASPYDNQGQRVVEGQRLMQAASDIFLGWSRDMIPPDFYWRQLRDWKGTVSVRGEPTDLEHYSRLCAFILARSHARSGDAIAISAYLGNRDPFDRAVCAFAESYAKTNAADHAAFTAATESLRQDVDGAGDHEPEDRQRGE